MYDKLVFLCVIIFIFMFLLILYIVFKALYSHNKLSNAILKTGIAQDLETYIRILALPFTKCTYISEEIVFLWCFCPVFTACLS